MTRTQASALIGRYILKYSVKMKRTYYSETPKWRRLFYRIFMAQKLKQKILESNDDPIRVVGRVFMELDEILGDLEEGQWQAHEQCAHMLLATEDILRLLKKGE